MEKGVGGFLSDDGQIRICIKTLHYSGVFILCFCSHPIAVFFASRRILPRNLTELFPPKTMEGVMIERKV